MNTADPTLAGDHANVNLGLKKRYEFSKESGIIEMAEPIFCDVFMSKQLLLSYVDLKILMNRNVDEFCLVASEADADYRVKLTEVYLNLTSKFTKLKKILKTCKHRGQKQYLVKCLGYPSEQNSWGF